MQDTDPFVVAAIVLGLVLAALVIVVWRKGRPFASGTVFRASRWSRGNHVFPTQVQVTPSAVVHFTPQWIGKREHSIHVAHVSSVTIDTNLLFSDVIIETSGGTSHVACHGHSRRDAVEMKRLIEHYQSLYYRQGPGQTGERPGPLSPAAAASDTTS